MEQHHLLRKFFHSNFFMTPSLLWKASEVSTLFFSLLSAFHRCAKSHESLTFFVKRFWESKCSSSWSKISFVVTFRHATTRNKPYRSTQSARRAVKTKLLMPNYPRFCATRPGPAERSTIFAFGVCPEFQPPLPFYMPFLLEKVPLAYTFYGPMIFLSHT